MNVEKIKVTLALRDPRARADFAEAVRGFEGAVLRTPEDEGAVEVLVYELGADLDKELAQLEKALRSGKVAEVFLAGSDPAPEVLIQAIRAGVKEFLPLPAASEEIRGALARYLDRRVPRQQPRESAEPAPQGKVLAVVGAKAGVGATTVAVNLALEMSRAATGGAGLLDLRREGGETPYFLDLECAYTWEEVTRNLARLDSTFLESILTRHASGLALLPAPVTASEILDEAALERLTQEMRRLFGQVVVDAGTAAEQPARFLELADEVILVLNLSLPCLARARSFLEALRGREGGVAGKVRLAAMRHVKGGEIEPAEAAEVLGQPIDWLLPDDAVSALAALNRGQSVAEAAPKSPLAKALTVMARQLGAGPAEKAGSGLFGFLRKPRRERQAVAANAAGMGVA